MNKKLMSYIAPAAGAVLGNFLGPTISEGLGVSAPVGAGLGAALGGTAGGLAGGQSFGRAAGMGAIGGLGAGVLNALTGSAAPSTAGGSAAGSAGAGSAAAAGGGGGAGPSVSPVDLTQQLGISPGQMATLNNSVTPAGMDISAGQTALLNNSGAGFSSPVISAPPSAATASLMPPAAAAPTAAAASVPGGAFNYGQSSIGKIMTSLGLPQNSVTEAIAKNPNLLLAGGGLAANMIMGNNETEGTGELRALAQRANERGERFSNYLESGQLPAGAQAGLTQATEAAKAAIRSKYASMNMSGSSAEMQELNDVDSRAQAQGFQMASNLLRTGVEETGIAANLYRALVGLNAQRDAATGRAISSFASALNGAPDTQDRRQYV